MKAACVCAKLLQSCDPLDCSPPGSSVHGILQARILGWVHPVKASGVETEKWSTSPDTRTKGEGVEPGLCLQAYCSSLSQVLIKQNSYPHA